VTRHRRTVWAGLVIAMAWVIAVAWVVAWTAAGSAVAAPETQAVVIMYHRFGEADYPSTNTTLAQLDAHLEELGRPQYNVVPLTEIVAALLAGRALPDRTVGLSIDDAFLSLHGRALPRLKKSGLPFTVFIATDAIDKKRAGYMSWDQIRALVADGGAIGSQTASHPHMPRLDPARALQELDTSNARFAAELGRRPDLLAYPYGEASLANQKVAREAGFKAAFGQHSGAIGGSSGRYYLPRFAMNEKHGSLERLHLAASALPLPVSAVTPADPMVVAPNPPAMGFTVDRPIKGLGRLTCYVSNVGKASMERLGEQRFEVRVEKKFARGRTRLNCTLPAGNGRWYWYGRQFFVP
jgi:peptidoglycan/xylan/chitin deacetylase (PgdA/CDA1 family)